MDLRPYQVEAVNRVREAWDTGRKNVCLVLPTGGGKTHTKSNLIKQMNLITMCIAHRQELVLQISESPAATGIYHRVIAPHAVVGFCSTRHMQLFGQSYVEATSDVAVAGVQTLLRRADNNRAFLNRVRLWDIDECHHVLLDNQWGQAASMFPNAIGLGVTATPLRCDRRGLDGVFDSLVIGPTMRELIDMGFLTDYRIFCPPTSIRLEHIRVSRSTGEYVRTDVLKEFA